MDKKDRYGRDRPFSGPVDRDNGRREREGPLSFEQGARYGIYGCMQSAIRLFCAATARPPPYTEVTEPSSSLV